MNLELKLQDRNLKWNWDNIADMIIKNPELMEELVHFALAGEQIVKQNASAVLGKISDRKSTLLTPYLITLIDHLNTNPEDAFKRNMMRTFQTVGVPEEREGELFNIALSYLNSSSEPIAVKAFSMTTARKISEKYPELALEVLHLIETIVKEKASSGLINRGKKEMLALQKLIDS